MKITNLQPHTRSKIIRQVQQSKIYQPFNDSIKNRTGDETCIRVLSMYQKQMNCFFTKFFRLTKGIKHIREI